jgi:RNA polymerase sigma-70 factor (ECF subfamily)
VTLTDALLLPLLRGCARGERKSQEHLYRLMYSYAAGISSRYARDREETVEIVNDAFLKVFNALPHYDPERHDPVPSFKGYFKKIVIGTAIDHYRIQYKHHLTHTLGELGQGPADDRETPLDGLAYDELIALVQQLSPAYRAVFNLYVIDGYSHEEIAERLGIAEGTSKSNLARARMHLRALIRNRHETRYATPA